MWRGESLVRNEVWEVYYSIRLHAPEAQHGSTNTLLRNKVNLIIIKARCYDFQSCLIDSHCATTEAKMKPVSGYNEKEVVPSSRRKVDCP